MAAGNGDLEASMAVERSGFAGPCSKVVSNRRRRSEAWLVARQECVCPTQPPSGSRSGPLALATEMAKRRRNDTQSVTC